jgi:hypothetical protein
MNYGASATRRVVKRAFLILPSTILLVFLAVMAATNSTQTALALPNPTAANQSGASSRYPNPTPTGALSAIQPRVPATMRTATSTATRALSVNTTATSAFTPANANVQDFDQCENAAQHCSQVPVRLDQRCVEREQLALPRG